MIVQTSYHVDVLNNKPFKNHALEQCEEHRHGNIEYVNLPNIYNGALMGEYS